MSVVFILAISIIGCRGQFNNDDSAFGGGRGGSSNGQGVWDIVKTNPDLKEVKTNLHSDHISFFLKNFFCIEKDWAQKVSVF